MVEKFYSILYCIMAFYLTYIFFLIGIFSHLTEVIAQGNGSSPVIEIEWLCSVPGSIAEIPINFTQGLDDGQAGGPDDITAISFTIDYDQANLIFDPTDGNDDGIPDSISFSVPGSFFTGVTLTGNPNGEISILIVDLFPPFVLLPTTDDIVIIEFELMDEVVYPIFICPVNASFSDRLANSILGEEICGGISCSIDLDSDGFNNDEDNCPSTPNGTNGGTCTSGNIGESCMSNGECGDGGFCSMLQEDFDTDGIGDVCDNCPYDPENDIDSDSVCGDVDNCPNDYNPNQEDDDSDEIGDICDNCPQDSNPNQEETDGDELGDVCDNCPSTPNGTVIGTCISGDIGQYCLSNIHCGTSGFCSLNQDDYDGDNIGDVCDADTFEDNYPPPIGNGCSDAYECEGDFDGDADQDATDTTAFLGDIGRYFYNNPCIASDPCNGDFDCDGDVDGADTTKFLEDLGRLFYNKPCPQDCQTGDWCGYTP